MPRLGKRHGPAYQELARRLRAAREDAGLTQAEAARSLGRPQSFISKTESGERRVDVVELAAIARLYGKKLADFEVKSS